MTTEMIIKHWDEKLEEIRKIFAPTLTQMEFSAFVELGKSMGLNPFLKEIWAIKYDGSKPAQIFISRDGYRTIIGRNPGYVNHFAEALYSNDEFEIIDINAGKFLHKYDFKNRGRLVGAYCMVYMQNSKRPYFVRVNIEEYDLNQGLWKSKKETMIKKIAECQAIRMAIPNLNGTYCPEENWVDEDGNHLKPVSSKATFLNDKYGLVEPESTIIDINDDGKHEIVGSFEWFEMAMLTAKSIDALKNLGSQIKDYVFTDEQKDLLRTLYAERSKELAVLPDDF